jgi:hypothetical protein
MRKNVEPQMAVTSTSSPVARVRPRTGGSVTRAGQTMVSVIVAPLRTIVPAAGSELRTVPKKPPRTRL